MKVIDPTPTFGAQMPLDAFNHPTKTIQMSPERFLKLALPKDTGDNILDPSVYDQQSLSNLKYRLERELDIDPPSFEVDVDNYEIVNHSGRHRALTAHNVGLKKIPVVLYFIKYCKTLFDKLKQNYVKPPQSFSSSKLRPETFRRPHEVSRMCNE